MIKYVFSLLFVLISVTVIAQKKSVVILTSSQKSEGMKRNGKDVLKVYKGVFQQDYSVMRSDSAYFYLQDNAFDAFGHVNITQGDTLNIFSDKLNYNGNTKVAVLTDNVKMIDKDATLTTNYLTYNTATRIGTYTGGGKLVNKDNTLTSKNGYYFAFSRDAYFRYNVVLVTPDALIKTDTLRYNTGTRISYFYGPTNIYDTRDKKDTLYTENGLYNTVTEQAFFGKKNLYKQGTKRLKGDSLFYDRKIGFGQAVKHVVFTDSEQKITLRGDLANYYKAQERTVVTKDPYVIIVTEEKDTTKSDTVKLMPETAKGKNKKASSPIKAPSLGSGAQAPPMGTPIKAAPLGTPIKATPLGTPIKPAATAKTDTTKKADTLAKAKKPEKVKRDSIYISADTLETQIFTYKDLKIMLEKERLARIRDTTAKPKKLTAAEIKAARNIVRGPLPIYTPPRYLLPEKFGKPDTTKKAIAKAIIPGANGKPVTDTTKKAAAPKKIAPRPDDDPAYTVNKMPELSDTARVRIVKAYHHSKLFKSDLQAKSDSMFYSYADSTLRLFVQPLIWTQGSQLSGDTITMQMRNKKLDNMDLFPNSFIVNIEKTDSTHFNQVSGKKMRGYFKNDKLDRMYISGNAESIYFSRDSLKQVSGMERSLSSRMRIHFEDNSASKITFLVKPEQRYGPMEKFTDDERILKGFIWKPKERPVSKESIIPSYNRKAAPPKTAAPKKGSPADKLKIPAPDGAKQKIDSVLNSMPGKLPLKLGKDTVSAKPTPLIKPKADSTARKPTAPAKPDSTKAVSPLKAKRDSTQVKKP